MLLQKGASANHQAPSRRIDLGSLQTGILRHPCQPEAQPAHGDVGVLRVRPHLEQSAIFVHPAAQAFEIIGQYLRQEIPKDLDSAPRGIRRRRKVDLQADLGLASGGPETTFEATLNHRIIGRARRCCGHPTAQETLEKDTEIQGVPCEASVFTEVSFHPDGKLAGCKLSRAFELDGVSLRRGEVIELDREGRLIR